MNGTPLHHMVRIRTTDDLTFVRAGMMDEIIVNANQEASADASGGGIALPVIVPFERLTDERELCRLLATVPTDGVGAYFVWTPQVPEELLLRDHNVFEAVLRLIGGLAERGIPIGHLHSGYVIAALHGLGVSAVVHHLGWVDKGEPAGQTRGGMRSCQVYVPGVRHCVRFDQADDLGRDLDADAYVERFCECAFCAGALAQGQHPLDLLLEDQYVPFEGGRRGRRTPTSRAVGVHTWHYLLSRCLEIEAFSVQPAMEVIDRDMDRAAALAGNRDTERLQRLASELRSA